MMLVVVAVYLGYSYINRHKSRDARRMREEQKVV